MNDTNIDILICIFEKCEIQSLFNLQIVCRLYNDVINIEDYLWELIAGNKWGHEFFNIAKRRTVSISRPLSTYKKELHRIMYITQGKWDLNDFYEHWYRYELILPNIPKGRFPI